MTQNKPVEEVEDIIAQFELTFTINDYECNGHRYYPNLPPLEISNWLRTTLTLRDQTSQEREREIVESKNNAYHERDMLVCALSKLFPAYLAQHDEADLEWENDWRWIVYVELPTGQVSWHIHDSEREMFNHLEVKANNWDGHNTERKYQRLKALLNITLTNPNKD